jgi:hypothetical protein
MLSNRQCFGWQYTLTLFTLIEAWLTCAPLCSSVGLSPKVHYKQGLIQDEIVHASMATTSPAQTAYGLRKAVAASGGNATKSERKLVIKPLRSEYSLQL